MTLDEIHFHIEEFERARNKLFLFKKKRLFYPWAMLIMSILLWLVFISTEIFDYGRCNIWGTCTYIYEFHPNILESIFVGSILGLIIAPFAHFFLIKKEINPKISFIDSEIAALKMGEEQLLCDAQNQKEEEEWQKQLDREIAREKALGQARNENVLQAMQNQISIMSAYRDKGLDVERQAMEMRKELLELEGKENEAMLNQLKTALDSMENLDSKPRT